MFGRVEGLEILRQGKQYGPILNTIENEGLREEQKEILPIVIDAGRGLIQRSILPRKIEEIYLRLMGIGENFLTNPDYVNVVEGDNKAMISHRRDLARLFVAMSPVVSSPDFNLKDISRHLLLKARQMTSEGDDCNRDLMIIETQNMLAKDGHRVDIYDTIDPLIRIIQNANKDLDRDRAVIDWSMETALLRRRGVGDVLETIDKNMPISEQVKIITRGELRLLQTTSREMGILLLNPTLPENNRVRIREDLVQISDVWI